MRAISNSPFVEIVLDSMIKPKELLTVPFSYAQPLESDARYSPRLYVPATVPTGHSPCVATVT